MGLRAEPRETIVPTPSWPRIGEVGPRWPAARERSVPQMPVWVRWIRREVGERGCRGVERISKVKVWSVGFCWGWLLDWDGGLMRRFGGRC